MYLVVSWSMESSYETPRISQPFDSLEAIAEAHSDPYDRADNRHDDGTLSLSRVVEGQGKDCAWGFSEISDADARTLNEMADAIYEAWLV